MYSSIDTSFSKIYPHKLKTLQLYMYMITKMENRNGSCVLKLSKVREETRQGYVVKKNVKSKNR